MTSYTVSGQLVISQTSDAEWLLDSTLVRTEAQYDYCPPSALPYLGIQTCAEMDGEGWEETDDGGCERWVETDGTLLNSVVVKPDDDGTWSYTLYGYDIPMGYEFDFCTEGALLELQGFSVDSADIVLESAE